VIPLQYDAECDDEEASKHARQLAEAEAEKQALLDRLKKPSGLSDEEAIQRAPSRSSSAR
jgi:hypothetical protein